MRKLHFKYAKARNFLCFGPEGIEIYFDDYSNIVNVIGQNLDVDPPRSNGTGKSTLPEIVVYAIYGKTIKSHKKIKHGNIINNIIRKKLYVEVAWDNYRVIRTRKPDSLKFYDGDKEYDLGNSPTQELINRAIGLNYETFTNVVIFNDRNDNAFLECDPAEKRVIVENLLSLEKYRQYNDVVKKMTKELKDNIKFLIKESEQLLSDKEIANKRVEQVKSQEIYWRNSQQKELQDIITKIKIRINELETTDDGKALSLWETAQQRMKFIKNEQKEINIEKENLEKLEQDVKDRIDKAKIAKHSTNLIIKTIEQTITDHRNQIDKEEKFIIDLQNSRGTRCTKCYSIVSDDNCNYAIASSNDKIIELSQNISIETTVLDEKKSTLQKCDDAIEKLKEGLKKVNKKQSSISEKSHQLTEEYAALAKIPRPQANVNSLLLEQEITELKKQAEEKTKTIESCITPYSQILFNAIQELKEKETLYVTKSKEINETNKLMPYYDYWSQAFGDSGIRKIVIDGIIPALNSNIGYWLAPLMSNTIELEFNNELEETIQRNPPDGDPFVYEACSRGEQNSLNLSVSRAFAYVMMLSWGATPSFVFLDEVGSNMDDTAKQGVYNMICELAKDRQVFVTTHDKYLLDLLHGCSELHLEKKQGFTTLVK